MSKIDVEHNAILVISRKLSLKFHTAAMRNYYPHSLFREKKIELRLGCTLWILFVVMSLCYHARSEEE